MAEKSERYDHKAVEARWQAEWEAKKAFRSRGAGSDKYYVLEMFPYPSGKIHMGHVRNYSIGDVLARFLRMRGKEVLHPMGWDSFGLPAENAAIQHGIHPARWTWENIDNMRAQLKRMGLSYDWDREVATCSPEYYRWNQWIFLKLLEKGLAYKKRSPVNWCPECATVLANEQVEDGRCWRCSSEAEMKELDQWFFRITSYAEELLEHTHRLPGWPERVLTMQRNWIGKSTGAEAGFRLEGSDESIVVFTTRPDTLYGVTFMSLAAGHPLVAGITSPERRAEVEAFSTRARAEAKAMRMSPDEVEKEGVFTGAYCLNPLTGQRVPVYVANFVLMEYGTGAVMAVPAHDQRDFEFAKKYALPVKVVINPPGQALDPAAMDAAYVEPGVMVNSGAVDGMSSTEAMGAITALLEAAGAGRAAVTYRLRDWGISRQRYWGCPIPVIYCEGCGTVPVACEDLPVILPEDVSLTGKGLSPLAAAGFMDASCPRCGSAARRETDTMDTFVDSSWYFLRYVSPRLADAPFSRQDAGYWMPVDQYIGGIEHAVMHLLYARFFTKALRDLGLHDFDEPFRNLLTQGMVCKEINRCPEHGYLYPEESEGGRCSKCSRPVEVGAAEKMSKSKKNVIDPDRIIQKYGADTTRLFSLFAAPPEKDLDWNEEGVEGSYRFLGRVWRLVNDRLGQLKGERPWAPGQGALDGAAKELHASTHRAIRKVTQDIEDRFHFNTAISSIMELVNALYQFQGSADISVPGSVAARVFREGVDAAVLLLAPFAPHISEELLSRLGGSAPVYASAWPGWSDEALRLDEVEIPVQVNGKVRGRVMVPAGADEAAVREIVMADARIAESAQGRQVRKFVYVRDKIVNMVVS